MEEKGRVCVFMVGFDDQCQPVLKAVGVCGGCGGALMLSDRMWGRIYWSRITRPFLRTDNPKACCLSAFVWKDERGSSTNTAQPDIMQRESFSRCLVLKC
ncbi:hypothetical protein PAMP_022349 [Pampus punctatissimus]